MTDGLNMSRRIRRTPYTDRVEKVGVRGYSVVNHMLLPKAYSTTVEEDYWHLREHVQIWDVSCQRQVQIEGPCAEELVQLMTPRNISRAKVGDCLYLPIIDGNAGLINDPVMIKLSENKFWLSIADSDVLLYATGVALGRGLDVEVSEPDVSPLAVQGPKAEDLLTDIFGNHIRDIGFFKYGWFSFEGTDQLIARSGYSRQGGFEIYLNDYDLGAALWDSIWDAGQHYEIKPGCPNLIERIEGGLLSYGNEMTRENNPLEFGLGKFCSFEENIEYLGKAALSKIAKRGVDREIRGVLFDGDPCPTCATPWSVMVDTVEVGKITSAIWSPRLKGNVGQALILLRFGAIGQNITVKMPDGSTRGGVVSKLPFD